MRKIVVRLKDEHYDACVAKAGERGLPLATWAAQRLVDAVMGSTPGLPVEVKSKPGRPPKPKTFMDDLSGTEKRALLIDSNDAGERCEGSLQRLEIPDWEKSTFPFLMCPFCNNRSLICVRLKDGSGTAVMREHLVGVKGEEDWGPVEQYGVVTEREKHDRDLIEEAMGQYVERRVP